MWQQKNFAQLSTLELFEIYKLRTAVFVVEQNCPYQEVDDKDLIVMRLFAKNSANLTAYCRIIPEEDGVHIGRVIVAQAARGLGLAKQLMLQELEICRSQWQSQPILIQAQAQLKPFYQPLGFEPTSAVYLEDNIPHMNMIFKVNNQ